MSKFIKLFNPSTNHKEKSIILKVLGSGQWASGAGTGFVSKFENVISASEKLPIVSVPVGSVEIWNRLVS